MVKFLMYFEIPTPPFLLRTAVGLIENDKSFYLTEAEGLLPLAKPRPHPMVATQLMAERETAR